VWSDSQERVELCDSSRIVLVLNRMARKANGRETVRVVEAMADGAASMPRMVRGSRVS